MTESYIVLLHDDEPDGNETLEQRIEAEFPGDYLRFTDLVFFVRGDDLSIHEVTDRLHLKRGDSPALVSTLTHPTSGHTWTRVWEWLRAREPVSP